jgi:hypothetical protein
MMVYKLHPGKVLRDSYTPQLLKIQILLMALTIGSIFFTVLDLVGFWLLLVCLVLMFISALPFTLRGWKSSPALPGWALLSVFVRAFAFVIGMGVGVFGMFLFRSDISRSN